jgi:prevent-host-death family protein
VVLGQACPNQNQSDTIVTLNLSGIIMKTELVTTLKREATKILAELHDTKEPVLITEHGLPSAYLIDVEDYEFMVDRMKLLEGIARGEKDILEGRVLTHAQAKDKLKKWLK